MFSFPSDYSISYGAYNVWLDVADFKQCIGQQEGQCV